MITAHELDEQLQTPDFTSQRIFADNQSIIGWLNMIWQELALLRKAIGQESPRPSIIVLPLGGNFVRFMADTITVSASAAATISLNIGAVAAFTWVFVGADTKVFPLPIELEPGKDYSLSASAGNATGYFVGYPEKMLTVVPDEQQGA